MIFGFNTKNTKEAKTFIKDTNQRLQSPDMVKNPFVGYCKAYEQDKQTLLCITKMTPLYPQLWYIGIFLIFFSIIFYGANGLLMYIAGGFMLITKIPFLTSFQLLIMSKGLKKTGHSYNISKLSTNYLIDWLIKWAKNK